VRVLIHCHGGPAIGMGHVARAAALAEVALDRGHQVAFSGTFEGPLVTERLATLGVEVVDEPDLTTYDVVHVDTYLPDGEDVARAARAAGVALLSNLEDGEFGRRPADLVVDPNLGAERTSRDSGPVLLRGSRWALLRRSVTEHAGQAALAAEARQVLVVMGGTDPLGVTGAVLDALAATGRGLAVTAIAQPAGRDELERRVAGYALDVELVPPRPDLAALMLGQDLVVSAAGTAVWELCCLGVPAALVCVADNQEAGYRRVLARGAAVGLGSAAHGLDHDAAVATLQQVLGDRALREQLSAAGTRLVDGRGAWRVVRSWEQLAVRRERPAAAVDLSVRLATEADADALLRWRDDPVTRAASRDTGEVGAEQHRAWLAATLADPGRHLLLAADDGGDVGTLRWDRREDGEWEVSVTVAPERRGLSLGAPLLQAGEGWLAAHEPATHTMLAAVHVDNAASLRLFDTAGYLPDLSPGRDGFLGLVKQRVPTG
jgi:spore coat polysaccharide biosynthesis predicted glycosyltransferase SpsG/RimJ/RimL family protein N-acetyltransferase